MDPTKLYNYLARSRARVMDAARQLTDEQYRAEFDVGLRSLARTFHHMRAAEAMYTRRIAGNTTPPAELPPQDSPEATSQSALAFPDLEHLWQQTAETTRAAIAKAAAGDWHTPIHFKSSWAGHDFEYDAAPADFFAQLYTHEIHHRAQAMAILTHLGQTVGEIDYSMLTFLPDDLPDD